MTEITGKSVYGGVAFGKIRIVKREKKPVKRQKIEDVEAEKQRFAAAKEAADKELLELYKKARSEIGEAEAQIFSIHRMMLDDRDYNESIINIISGQRVNAETAVLMTSDSFARVFSEMEDAYMRDRAADVHDVSDRVIAILIGDAQISVGTSEEAEIVAADDLAPSETIRMNKDKILAFVMEKGSSSSHTAILARSMNIPAIIGASGILNPENDGKFAAVDGLSGRVYIEPDEKTTAELSKKQAENERRNELLKTLKNEPTVTKSGQSLKLYANIGTPEDVGNVLLNGAEGIGLFRSEFLYLKSRSFPSEDTQFEAYKRVAEAMGDKPVIIRTLDIGADKKIDYFKQPEEENPALGMRAIRVSLTHIDIFKTQLRAILRASAFGKICIMLPLIVSVDEVRSAKKIIDDAKQELERDGIPFAEEVPVGIMIETPAAAIISDLLAKEADFFSIGTNDLTQYMLAADRGNSEAMELMDTHHPAILRVIRTVAENAHINGIWAGICGELGADTELLGQFLDMGLDELSVSPGKILEIRQLVRETE